MPGPLEGLRVLDFGRYGVGPAAGMYLGQLGADVIKIESPRGDGSQRVLPLKQGMSIVYMTLNSCKRNILLDLRDEDDRAIALQLASGADIVIENFRPGVMAQFGLDFETLSEHNPRLIYCAASGYGSRGPMSNRGSTDHFGQAMSGFTSLNGEPDGEPEFLRQAGFVDIATAQRMVQGILVALRTRELTGRGQMVETSQLEAGLWLVAPRLAEFLVDPSTPARLGSAHPACVPDQAFKCADGRWIYVTAQTNAEWHALCRALDRESLADDPRFARNRDRLANRAELSELLATAFDARPAEEWSDLLIAAGVPAAVHWNDATHAPLLADPHVVANELLLPIETHWGRVNIVRPPWEFSRTPATLFRSPAPNEHEEEIRRLANQSGAAAVPASNEKDAELGGSGPLSGLRVIDISQGYAGPSCSLLLGDLGADVIKVEPPSGDYTRELGAPVLDGNAAVFLALNRSKRSVVLDLSRSEDLETLRDLVARADIFITDQLPKVRQAAGTDYDSLKQTNEQLIYCAITPFGETGPYEDRPGSELTIQGLSGITRFLGRLDGPPLRVGADVVGMNTGVYAFIGILAALHRRSVDGLGQQVSVNQLLSLLSTECSQLARESDPDEWVGASVAVTLPPEHPYRTADGAVYFTMGITNAGSGWFQLFRDLGLEHLCDDPRFANPEERAKHHIELAELLEERFAELSSAEVLEYVFRGGGLGAPCHSFETLLDDPQVAVMELITSVQHPKLGELKGVDVPFDLLATPHQVTLPPPELGQHTQEVLEALGAQRTREVTHRG